jgi:hypothetical protein
LITQSLPFLLALALAPVLPPPFQGGQATDRQATDRRVDPAGTVVVEPALQRDPADHRDEDRRCGGHEGEQADDAGVQARGGEAGAAGAQQPDGLARDEAEQRHDEHCVHQEQAQHHRVGGGHGHHAGQHVVVDRPRDDLVIAERDDNGVDSHNDILEPCARESALDHSPCAIDQLL